MKEDGKPDMIITRARSIGGRRKLDRDQLELLDEEEELLFSRRRPLTSWRDGGEHAIGKKLDRFEKEIPPIFVWKQTPTLMGSRLIHVGHKE